MPTVLAFLFVILKSFGCFIASRELWLFMDNSEVAQLDWIVHNFVVGFNGSNRNERPKISPVYDGAIWRECLCIVVGMWQVPMGLEWVCEAAHGARSRELRNAPRSAWEHPEIYIFMQFFRTQQINISVWTSSDIDAQVSFNRSQHYCK